MPAVSTPRTAASSSSWYVPQSRNAVVPVFSISMLVNCVPR